MAGMATACTFRVFVSLAGSDVDGVAAKAVRLVRGEDLAQTLERIAARFDPTAAVAAGGGGGRLSMKAKDGTMVEIDGVDDLEPDDCVVFHAQAAPLVAPLLTTTGKRSKNSATSPIASPTESPAAGGSESTEEDDEDEDEDEEQEILRALEEVEEEERAKSKRQPRPTIDAYIDPSDVPVERGGTWGAAATNSGDDENEDAGLQRIKARIAKMLALGLHAGTSEAEAQQSMRQAQRLLNKYNLDQAAILSETGGAGLRNEGAMAGGMAKVQLFKARTKHPAKMDRTAEGLALCCAKNFEVRYFKRRSRSTTQIVFYGLLSGAQLAAYAFTVAFTRVHLMQKTYHPPVGEYDLKIARGETQCTVASYTATARRNYADGLVHGLHNAVRSALERRIEQHAAKLRKAQHRAERWRRARERGARDGEEAAERAASAADCQREAYDEDEDDDDDDGCHQGGDDDTSDASSDAEDHDDLHNFDPDQQRPPDETSRPIDDKLVAAEAQLAKLRRTSAAAQALVVHTTAVSETVLKDAGVKLKGGRKRKALVEHNAAAWAQGKRDATQIDLNQNAIGGPKRSKAIGQ
jgi:hypothetical protein